MTSRIRSAYDIRIEEGVIAPDPAQLPLILAMERLETDLARKGLFGKHPEVKGLYIWGPPGRGKSMLMDLFVSASPEPRKTRAHFHAFMARVHSLVDQWRKGDRKTRQSVFGTHSSRKKGGDDPIEPVADLIASEARLLCFDELQVTDIADAMILGRLFEALFERKVVLAVTSNRAPNELYKNGLNRQLFVPFIDELKKRCVVIEIDGARDWRLDRLMGSPVWFVDDGEGNGEAGREAFETLWYDLKGGETEEPAHLAVLGRDVVVERTAGGLARSSFADLCARPLGPQDYLAIARRFHTLFIENIPTLSPDNRQEAARFITLIDALYEAGTRLVATSAAQPETLYVKGDGAFEFERTVSRLREMSSQSWLEKATHADPLHTTSPQ
jgi:cell division protein ZapE